MNLKLLGAVLAAGLAGGAFLQNKFKKNNKVNILEVDLPEGVNPEDVTVLIPKKAQKGAK